MTQSASANPTAAPMPRKTISLKQVVKILVSVVLLALLLHNIGAKGTLSRLLEANLWYIPIGVGLYLFAQVISSYRWQFLSAALGFNLSLREFYDYYLIGMFFNLFLPGAIGGDMLRMFYLAKSANRKKREALLTLLAERGVGLVALLLLISVVCITPALAGTKLTIPLRLPPLPVMSFDLRLILLCMSGLMLTGYLCLWVAPLERLVEKVPKLELIGQARVYWANLGLLAKSVSISLFVHGLMVGMHLLIASALNIHVDILYITVVYGVVSLASVIPISFNGLGVREGVYVYLLTQVGFTEETALAFAFYWLIISTCTSLIGGLILVKGHYKTPSIQEETDMIDS